MFEETAAEIIVAGASGQDASTHLVIGPVAAPPRASFRCRPRPALPRHVRNRLNATDITTLPELD